MYDDKKLTKERKQIIARYEATARRTNDPSRRAEALRSLGVTSHQICAWAKVIYGAMYFTEIAPTTQADLVLGELDARPWQTRSELRAALPLTKRQVDNVLGGRLACLFRRRTRIRDRVYEYACLTEKE